MTETIHSTSTLARAAGVTEALVRVAVRKGVLTPKRNALGHALFCEADVAEVSLYARRGMRSLDEQIKLAEESGLLWEGGAARVSATGQFVKLGGVATAVVVMHVAVRSDGTSGQWRRVAVLTEAGSKELSLERGLIHFDIEKAEHAPTIEVSIDPVAPREKELTDLEALRQQVAALTDRVTALEAL